MGKISLKGVVIGGITDIVATNILAIPLIAYVIAAFGLSHLPPDQMSIAIVSTIHDHWPLHLVQATTGIGCSILGGYVAARLARRGELLNGTLSSFLCVGIGIYSIITGQATETPIAAIVALVSSPVFALLGGYLRSMQGRKAALAS